MIADKIIYLCFPIYAFVKHVNPGRGDYWPKEYNLNKLGRGLLDDASYQISKL